MKGTGFWHILKQARHLEASDISLRMKDKLTKEEFEGFVMRSWAIWSERLRLTHLRNAYPCAINVEWCTNLLKDFQEARQALWLAPHHEPLSSPNSWIAPRVNTLRLDVDASYNEGSNSFALGGIIRSHEGQPILAFGKNIAKPISVSFAELLAIQIGVNISREHNIDIHLITSDSLLAVQAVTSGDENRSYVGTLALDIRGLLSHLGNPSLRHVRRTANNVVHSIASFACSSPPYFVWKSGDFLFWLINLVIKDLDIFQ
ncbi:uncharacterized protein [Primulina eburnea]|uniref:uncharacterized protein n=1 Tax=Primulina eburnea TaxID=1245227 RepID=UPI003C6C5893